MSDARAKASLALTTLGATAMLVAAWLPFQTPAWSAWRMAGGYAVAGGRLDGPLVGAFHLVPHFIGLVLIAAVAIGRRKPRLATDLLIWSGALWLGLLVRFELRVMMLPELHQTWLWPGLAGAAVVGLVVPAVIGLRSRGTQRGRRLLGLVLIGAAWAQVAGQAAFALIEDQADLTWGAAATLSGLISLALGGWLARGDG